MSHLILADLGLAGVVMTVVGLGFLIFFHELGHFLACRLTGTRVEAFSIGFGPKLVGWRRGATLYKVSAIPLGGYVKMAAENPGERNTGAPDEFPNKSFGQRLFIMSAGVLFNVLLGFVLYVWAFRIGVPLEPPLIGRVEAGEAGWEAGLRPGDRVTHVDGEEITSFDELQMAVAFSDADEEMVLTVLRDGGTIEVRVRPRYSAELGRPHIGVVPAYRPAAVRVEPDSPAAKAGGREGDAIVAVDGVPVQGPLDLGAPRDLADAEAVPLRLRVRRDSGEEADLALSVPVRRTPQIGIFPYRGQTVRSVSRDSPAASLLRAGDELLSVNGRPVVDVGLLRDAVDGGAEQVGQVEVRRGGEVRTLVPEAPLTVAELTSSVAGGGDPATTRVTPRPGMPAQEAGLLPGDRIVEVQGTATDEWTDIQEAVGKAGSAPVDIVVDRDGTRLSFRLEPVLRGIGIEPLGYEWAPVVEMHRETGVAGAMAMGWRRTVTMMKQVLLTLKSLVTRRVSVENIGGPILLAQVTYQMFDLGWGKYLMILALISINLAVLNLLPIPVLDGGQMVLLCAEKLRGRPLPERLVGYFQLVGLVMILGLMVLAFHNDIVRLLQ